jgi:crotonobetaine/carnitine-CoA ligase
VLVTSCPPAWQSPLGELPAAPLSAGAPGSPVAAGGGAAYDDLHCVVYSSGTTGPSKGIMISNAHAVAKAFEVIEICGFTEDDVLYSPLPLFYSMGLLRGVLSVAITGGSIVLRDRFSVSAYWDEARRTGATVGHTVFSLPAMLKSQPPAPSDRDHRLRCMFNARHDPEFEDRFGVRLIEGYGLTEAGNAIFSRRAEPSVPDSCGTVSEEWEVRLADEYGEEVPVGSIGEILIRPREPHRLMLGYLNKAETTVAAFRDLWFRTGDLASRDDSGHYFYVGRTKEMIRRRGQNISAWELEQVVSRFPAIAEVAALAHPAEIGDDDVRLVVAPAPGATLDLAALADFCEERLPAFMVPRYLEVRKELPKTPSGRIEKYKLLADGMSGTTLDRHA